MNGIDYRMYELQQQIRDKFEHINNSGGIETLKCPRQVGKTTTTAKILEVHSDVAVIVPYKMMIQLYPKHLRDRVFSVYEIIKWESHPISYDKFIVDEGFGIATSELIRLYYILGRDNKSVLVLGS